MVGEIWRGVGNLRIRAGGCAGKSGRKKECALGKTGGAFSEQAGSRTGRSFLRPGQGPEKSFAYRFRSIRCFLFLTWS
ncbi:MAG: hypothetical protein D3914_10970 [Candidatus Electrothrix sp. LOE2]|nr:hypothetical protein [Candidatus Electrothrix sp. LOE2]